MMQLTKWEYLYVRVNDNKVISINGQFLEKSVVKRINLVLGGGEDLAGFLAKVGEEGWELVSTAGLGINLHWVLVFKRSVQ